MKTRNQFLQRIVRLAVSTFAAALLGIGLGNFMRNEEILLVKTDSIGMDHVNLVLIDNKISNLIEFIKPVKVIPVIPMYTQSDAKLVAELPLGIEMNACYFEGRRLGEILIYNAKPNMPGVKKLQINHPPRGDTIDPNTS